MKTVKKSLFILWAILLTQASYAQKKDVVNVEKIADYLLTGDKAECVKIHPDCKRIFEYVGAATPATLETKLKSAAVSGTVYEMAEICGEGDQTACAIVEAIFNDKQDDCQKFSKPNSTYCSDVRDFRLNSCSSIQDNFLGSVCSKQLLPACRNDITCLVSWTYIFREDGERLRTTTPGLLNVFTHHYEADKNFVIGNLNIFPPTPEPEASRFVKAPLFPSPKKSNDILLSKTNSSIKSTKTKPEFKPLASIKSFSPSMRGFLQPWVKGEGVTVVDWDGDGYLDVFTVNGDEVLYFDNVEGKEFKKFSINLPSFGLKGSLIDISVADIDGSGTPVILVQSYPRTLYVMRWLQERSSFVVETVILPNHSTTHAYVQFKSGIGIVFPGWNGNTSIRNQLTSDYIARIKNKKWNFEKIPSSNISSLSVSVVQQANNQQTLLISKDFEGGVEAFNVVNDDLVKIPKSDKLNFFSYSTAYLSTSKKEDLWLTTGLNFDDSKIIKKKNAATAPREIEICKKEWHGKDKMLCVVSLSRFYTNIWGSLCLLFKDTDMAKLCQAQNEFAGISGVKNVNPTHYSAQVFRNLNAPVIDSAASDVVSSIGQARHIAPLQSPAMEGFFMSEIMTRPTVRKLWWMGYTKNGMQKTDLTNSLGLSAPYDAAQFALADFDRDGQLDMVFKSGTDMVFLKGDTGGDSSLNSNLQMGNQSRTLIKIPANPKEQ